MEDLLLYLVEVAVSGLENRIEPCGVSFGKKQWMLYVFDHPLFIFDENELKMLKVIVSARNYKESDPVADTRFSWLFEHTIGL